MAGQVRQSIDLKSLERWLNENVPEIQTPLDLKQFGFGQSNPTYQITSSAGTKYVLRKKPPGKLFSKTAHQVDREYRIIHALRDTDVPVPKAYCLCEDESIIGTPFYIMSFLNGRMVTEAHFPGVSPTQRREMWHDAIRTLAKFHKVDPQAIGLDKFGRGYGFYDRQIKTFSTISAAQSQALDVDTNIPVGPIPHFDDMVRFFRRKSTQPRDRATLVHGDYKIDNLVFHPTEPRVIGILDWEMATIGHPLSDLVNLTGPWSWTRDVGLEGGAASNQNFEPGVHPGLPTLDEVVQWYTEESEYDAAPDMGWGNAFGGFRGAVIMQGIAARYARRQASGVTARNYAGLMRPYGEWAWEMVRRIDKGSGKDDEVGKSKL